MRNRWIFRPHLDDCVLEDRVAPAVSNLGITVLTTSGYVMVIPFPGAYVSSAVAQVLGNGSPGPFAAPGVNGALVSTSFFVIGTGGISSVLPGNFTGFPSLSAYGVSSSIGSASLRIFIGSGADEATGADVPAVTRNTVANDALNALPVIGGRPSVNSSPVLPAGESYRNPPPMPAFGVGLPSGSSGPGSSVSPDSPYPPTGVPPIYPFNPMRIVPSSPASSATGNSGADMMKFTPGGAPGLSPVGVRPPNPTGSPGS